MLPASSIVSATRSIVAMPGDAEQSAHTLKGSISHFLDPELVAPLQELESMSKAGRLEEARQRFTAVEALLDSLLLSMSEHLRPASRDHVCLSGRIA